MEKNLGQYPVPEEKLKALKEKSEKKKNEGLSLFTVTSLSLIVLAGGVAFAYHNKNKNHNLILEPHSYTINGKKGSGMYMYSSSPYNDYIALGMESPDLNIQMLLQDHDGDSLVDKASLSGAIFLQRDSMSEDQKFEFDSILKHWKEDLADKIQEAEKQWKEKYSKE